MTKQEQLLLRTVIDSLISCSVPRWTKGNLDQWADYAKSMRAAIESGVKVLQTINHQDFQLNDPVFSKKLDSLEQEQTVEKPVDPKENFKTNPWN